MKTKFSGRACAGKCLVIILAAGSAVVTTNAQSPRARERASENARFNRRAMSDEEFIREAYARGLAELGLAHIAVQVSRDPDIDRIGHRVINEQGRANDDLRRLADARNITLPTVISQADQRTYDRMARLPGGEFDREYRRHLDTDYRQTIELFAEAAQRARDPQVRDVAAQYANLFEQHAQVIGIRGLPAGVPDSAYGRSRERTYVRGREGGRLIAPPLSDRDAQLLMRAYQQSRTESEAAQLALRNSRDRAIRTEAQNIIAAHQAMEQDMADLAARRGLALPRELLESQRGFLNKASRLSGNEFDRDYHDYLMISHRNSIQLFDQAAGSNDPEVAGFAMKYRDLLRQQGQDAQRVGEGSNR